MKDVRYFGYLFGMKSPGAVISLEYRHPANFNLPNVTAWLQDYCEIPEDRVPAPPSQRSDPTLAQVHFAVSSAIVLYGEFLCRAAVPCYDPGKVLNIQRIDGRPDAFRVAVALQLLDNVPSPALKKVLDDAIALVRQPFCAAPEPQMVEAVLSRVLKQTIEPLAAHVPFYHGQETIMDLADRHHVPYRHLGLGVVRMGWGSKSVLIRYSETQFDSAIGLAITGNKQMTARVLRSAGFPGAEHVLASSLPEAESAAREYGWPVVVKPPNREKSEGVTAFVDNVRDLAKAYETASAFAPMVMVERQAPGFCHRIMVAQDEVIYVIRRVPKSVRGDGQRSVSELVAAYNIARLKAPPWSRLAEWPLDEEADACLARQGHSRTSVPDKDEMVLLRNITDAINGGNAEDVTPLIHPDNARLAVEVTRYLGMSFAGVDLIIPDISRSWRETGCLINEVNFRPQFRWRGREHESMKIIAALIDGDGRIPVHAVTGEGDLMAKANALTAELSADGAKCWLTSADHTQAPCGETVPMVGGSLFDRTVALLLRPDVDALVLAGTEPEFMQHGFSVDRLESLHVLGLGAAGQEVAKRFKAHIDVRSVNISRTDARRAPAPQIPVR